MTTLKVGDNAPNFKALDEQGQTVSLTDFKGKKLVVFFYPKANTPGCTAEACNLRDNYAILKDKGYEIIGVSADAQKKQSNFKEKFSFPYPLIADEDKAVINAFGVWGPKKFICHCRSSVFAGCDTQGCGRSSAVDAARQILGR